MVIQNQTLLSQLKLYHPNLSLYILKQEGPLRVSIIKSEDTSVIYAITRFRDNISNDLLTVHNEVLNGSFIGETAIKHGFRFLRMIKATFEVSPLPFFQAKEYPKGIFSSIYLENGKSKYHYCDICEILNPVAKYDLPKVVYDFHTNDLINTLLKLSLFPAAIIHL